MKLKLPLCPQCGAGARGTVERLSGVAEFDCEPGTDIDVQYSGRTNVWWDEQRTAYQNNDAEESADNLPLVCCAEGHEWPTAIDWSPASVPEAGTRTCTCPPPRNPAS